MFELHSRLLSLFDVDHVPLSFYASKVLIQRVNCTVPLRWFNTIISMSALLFWAFNCSFIVWSTGQKSYLHTWTCWCMSQNWASGWIIDLLWLKFVVFSARIRLFLMFSRRLTPPWTFQSLDHRHFGTPELVSAILLCNMR